MAIFDAEWERLRIHLQNWGVVKLARLSPEAALLVIIMPLKLEPPPSVEELKKAVSDLFYAATQNAAFGYLKLIEQERNFVSLKA